MYYRTIYENLAKAFTEDQQALYLQRVGEVEPNIRYCAYNIGDESAIQDLMQMRREAGGGKMSTELDVGLPLMFLWYLSSHFDFFPNLYS